MASASTSAKSSQSSRAHLPNLTKPRFITVPYLPGSSYRMQSSCSGVNSLNPCRLTLQNTDNPTRWHVSARIQLTAPGVGCDPGKMRTYLGVRSSENEIVFNVPRPDIEDYQVYLRYRLIDSVTGYRNNWKKKTTK